MVRIVSILAAACFIWYFCTILSSALKNRDYRPVVLKGAAAAFLGGLVLYGWCYFSWFRAGDISFGAAAFRTLLDTGGMFTGGYADEAVQSAPLAGCPTAAVLFWFFHLLAFFSTVAAVLSFVGVRLLRLLRCKRRDLDLIYGVSGFTLEAGRVLARRDRPKGAAKHALIYVDDRFGQDSEKAVQDAGGLLYHPSDNPDLNLFRQFSFHEGKRKFCLYAISPNYEENLACALSTLELLEQEKIPADQTSLVMLGREDGNELQAMQNHPGYGSVRIADEAGLSARLLIQKHPICNVLRFDENAKAVENVHILLVGFGETGKAVLRTLTACGQFEGSTFHADVFDADMENRGGLFRSNYYAMCQQYNIRFHSHGGQSEEMARFLDGNGEKLNYIVIAMEDLREGRQTAAEIAGYLEERGFPRDVCICSREGVMVYQAGKADVETWNLYDREILLTDEMDRYAKQINHCYSKGEDAESDWKKCKYFHRMSSRASADYLFPLLEKFPLYVRSDKDLSRENVDRIQKIMENLAKSEHLRWCAFYYTMGYSPMSEAELNSRCARYRADVEAGKPPIHIGENAEEKTHACMTPWEKLDALSETENAVTKGNKNYKEYDYQNVDAVVSILRRADLHPHQAS